MTSYGRGARVSMMGFAAGGAFNIEWIALVAVTMIVFMAFAHRRLWRHGKRLGER